MQKSQNTQRKANKFDIQLKSFCLNIYPNSNQTFRPNFQFIGNRRVRRHHEVTTK